MSLRKNTVWNLIGTGTPILIGLVTVPFIVKHIGIEAFGILTLVWTLIGYFSLFDFGLGRALTQQVASCLATGKQEQIPHLVKSGLFFIAGTGVLGGIILAILSHPLGFSWLKVTPALQPDAAQCLLVASLGIPLTTITAGLGGIVEAFEDFRGSNLFRIALGVANFSLPALSVVLFGPSLTIIVMLLILARLVILIAYSFLLNSKLAAYWYRARVSLQDIKNLLSFGMWMTVSNIISPLMQTADRFVISSVMGASVVAYYTLPFDMLIRVLILPAALTGALFPRLTSLLGTDQQAAKLLYHKCLKVVVVALLPICLVMALGSYWGLTLWLGKDFAEHSWIIVCIMSLGVLLNGAAFVPFATIQAKKQAQITAKLHVFEFIIYIPLLLVLLHAFGLYGAAIVWVIRVGLDLILLLFFAEKIILR